MAADPSAADTPSRIRAAATRLFGSQGFAATSMQDIMVACDLTKGAFYNHFRSKEDLLYDLVLEAHRLLESELTVALDDALDDAASQLNALTRTFASWHCRFAELARVANKEYVELSGATLRDIKRRRRDLRQEFELVLARGVQVGQFELPNDPTIAPMTARTIVEMLVSIANWYDDRGPVDVDGVASFYAAFVARAVGAPT